MSEGMQLIVKNTFIDLQHQRLDARRFASAPAELFPTVHMLKQWDREMQEERKVMKRPRFPVTTLTKAETFAQVNASVVENLRVEPAGRMTLATLGNRIPKTLAAALRDHGTKFARYIHNVDFVKIKDGVVQLVGMEEDVTQEVEFVCKKGEFLRALRSRRLSESELQEVLAVLESVHAILRNSERKAESPCALGNKLAPRNRAFLTARRARLIELLHMFPWVFASIPVAGSGCPHIGVLHAEGPLTMEVLKPFIR
uniref:Uncharacterized protein n=1 Tax=Oxyrrhis marina TaxID=2969 RepID=A0A7S4GMI5_OXYMA|mmetsp:Transcript_54801/g.146522  ORF Transcript_54801/g.146522 Transcript_54801/m.146522 type:complete len:256 (+) Transcript_54801:31-798(+)